MTDKDLQELVEFCNALVTALDDLGTKITGFIAYFLGKAAARKIAEEESVHPDGEEEDMIRDTYKGIKINKRVDGRWYARYTIAPGIYKDIYGKTKIACVTKLKNFLLMPSNVTELLKKPRKKREPKPKAPPVPTFRQFFRKWIEVEKAPNVSPVTYDHYLSNFRSWFDRDPIADMPMNAISTDYLREFLARMWSPTMRRRIYIMLGDIFRTAVEYGVIERSPMTGVKPPKKVITERPAFLREEEQRFVEEAKKSDVWIIFALMLYEGLRSGEARAFRPCDIKQDRIEVAQAMNDKGVIGPTKTGRKRYVPIFEDFKELADKYRGESTEPIFGTVNKHLAQKEYLDIVKKLGLQHLNMYALRHTFATRCAEAGIIPNQISLWMGHSDLKTTMQYYVSISPDFERENVERKDKADRPPN